eukprot:7580-Heterococcus_DN1.PRE.1
MLLSSNVDKSTPTAKCKHDVQQLEEVLLVMRDHLGAARSETVTARASAASASAQHREAIALLESDARTAREWRAKADVALTQFPREREALQAQITLLEKEARRKGEADDSRTRRWQDALQSIAKECVVYCAQSPHHRSDVSDVVSQCAVSAVMHDAATYSQAEAARAKLQADAAATAQRVTALETAVTAETRTLHAAALRLRESIGALAQALKETDARTLQLQSSVGQLQTAQADAATVWYSVSVAVLALLAVHAAKRCCGVTHPTYQ